MSTLIALGQPKIPNHEEWSRHVVNLPAQVVEQDAFPFDISRDAIDKIRHARHEGDESTHAFLRIGVRGGGCAGLQYTLDFTEEVHDDDWITLYYGEPIAMDFFSAHYLEGAQLEYIDSLHGSGFKFVNPNAERTCGCGSSFSS